MAVCAGDTNAWHSQIPESMSVPIGGSEFREARGGGGPLVVQVVWGGRRRDQNVTLLESAGRITSITVLHISVITLL